MSRTTATGVATGSIVSVNVLAALGFGAAGVKSGMYILGSNKISF